MMVRLLLLCMVMLPALADAEIYKWKDKDGRVRYSDIPPPSNVKTEPMLGKKIPKPTGQAPLTPVEGDVTKALNRNKTTTEKEATPISKEEAAKKRAADAESKKREEEAKQADLKIRQQNCKAARSNYATFKNGGRITRTDENGERQYLGDEDISQGLADAQRDIEKYCD